MDERMQPGRDITPSRSAPSAPNNDETSLNGRRDSSRTDGRNADQSSSSKPALTDRERNERWPVG
jgi:hypothetical protein